MKFKGIITALITPFNQGELDKDSFLNLIKQGLDQGIDGFVINGTTGEAPALRVGEVEKLLEWAKIEVGGQVPLILGVGSNSTKQTCSNIERAQKWKADGVLAVVPYYNKPTQEGLLKHYTRLDEISDLPILLYNVPARTVVGMELNTITELSKLNSIVGIKEATGDIDFGENILKSVSEDFLVSSGDDSTFLELSQKGGRGTISVSSHFLCKSMKEAYNQVIEGDASSISKFKSKHSAIIDFLYKVSNPIMIKQALYLKKWIKSPELRLPLCEPSPDLQNEMKRLLQELE